MTLPPPPDAHAIAVLFLVVLALFLFTREWRFYHPFGGEVAGVLPDLPIVVLSLAAQDVDLSAEPEEGTQGEVASALDRVEDAEKELEKLEAEDDAISQKRAEAEKAQETAREAAHRAERAAEAKEAAAKEAAEMGTDVKNDDKNQVPEKL